MTPVKFKINNALFEEYTALNLTSSIEAIAPTITVSVAAVPLKFNLGDKVTVESNTNKITATIAGVQKTTTASSRDVTLTLRPAASDLIHSVAPEDALIYEKTPITDVIGKMISQLNIKIESDFEKNEIVDFFELQHTETLHSGLQRLLKGYGRLMYWEGESIKIIKRRPDDARRYVIDSTTEIKSLSSTHQATDYSQYEVVGAPALRADYSPPRAVVIDPQSTGTRIHREQLNDVFTVEDAERAARATMRAKKARAFVLEITLPIFDEYKIHSLVHVNLPSEEIKSDFIIVSQKSVFSENGYTQTLILRGKDAWIH